jgi:hypothetical protein
MVKRTKNKKRVARKAPVPKGIVAYRQMLDKMALDYARLLLDPCNAPLSFPVYGGADGSYLVRCESFVSIGNGAGITSGAFQWTPGYIGQTVNVGSVDKSILVFGDAAATQPKTVTALGSVSPGWAWIRNNSSEYRAVAACLSVFYAGTELNRSGQLSFGCVTAGLLGGPYFDGVNVTANDVMTGLPNMTRTPEGTLEVLWRPAEGDSIFKDPTTSEETGPSSEDLNRHNSCTVAYGGLTAATGFTCKMTAVYEYKPKIGTGMALPTRTIRSGNTLAQVLGFIDRAYANPWVRHAVTQMAGQILMRPRRNARIEEL